MSLKFQIFKLDSWHDVGDDGKLSKMSDAEARGYLYALKQGYGGAPCRALRDDVIIAGDGAI